jgi:2-methylcitrate dehydratase PrpD
VSISKIAYEPTLAKFLAGLIVEIREAELTDAQRSVVRQHLLDGISSAFVGCRSGFFRDVAALSTGVRSPQDLGLLWSFAINGSVFEDGSREGACHPAAAVLATVMAFAEGREWRTIDRAIVAGYDVMVRLARCGNPQLIRRGFHPTAVAAPFAAAAVVSQMLGYDALTTEQALCLAAMGSSGLMASFKQGSTQPLQVAWGVRNGIAAALLAGSGQLGYDRIFEEGFFPAYLGTDASAVARSPLEFNYAIEGSYLKPYPGCRHMHATLDAFDDLVKRHALTLEDLGQIRVGTYKIAIDTEIEALNTRGDAYFNIPYAIAARIVLGNNGYDAFDEKHFHLSQIAEVRKLVSLSVDAELEAKYPKQRGSKVEVELKNGQVVASTVRYALGEPENPLPVAVTLEKFRSSAAGILSAEDQARIESMLTVSDGPAGLEAVSQAILTNIGNMEMVIGH